jgi:hypothetical protein
MDIQVTSIDPVTGVVSVGIPEIPRRLTGLDKLTQAVVLTILKNPGRDVFLPEEGAGFRAMIGQYNFTGVEELRSLIAQRVALIEAQMLASQSIESPASERLKKISIQDIAYDELTRGLYIRLRIVNEADAESDVVV